MPDASLPPLPPVGQPRWRIAVDELRGRSPVPPWVAAAALVVLLVVVGMAWLRPATPAGRPGLPMATPAPPEPPAPGPAGSRTGPGEESEVIVDVAGAVARPGLVRLRAGSRVADALAAAGGPSTDAVLAGVNQARVLADGEQVRVPRVGEPALPPPAAIAGSAPPASVGPLGLNLATPAELDTLPGVGPATAAAIVAWRDENGGFRRVEDLLEVPGIGPARLDRLRPHVRV